LGDYGKLKNVKKTQPADIMSQCSAVDYRSDAVSGVGTRQLKEVEDIDSEQNKSVCSESDGENGPGGDYYSQTTSAIGRE